VTVENHSGRSVQVQHWRFRLRGQSGFQYAALSPFSLSGEPRPSPPPNQNPQKLTPPAAPEQNPNTMPEPGEGPGTIQRSNPSSALNDSAEITPALASAFASDLQSSDWESGTGKWGRVEHAFAVESYEKIERVAPFGAAGRPYYAAPARAYFPYSHVYGPRYYPRTGAYFYWGYPRPYWYWGWGASHYWYYPYAWYPYYWTVPLPSQDMIAQALPEGAVNDGGRVSGFVYFQHVASREHQVSFEMQLVDGPTGEEFGSVSIPFIVQ